MRVYIVCESDLADNSGNIMGVYSSMELATHRVDELDAANDEWSNYEYSIAYADVDVDAEATLEIPRG